MAIVTASREPRRTARAEPVGSLIRSQTITEHLDRIYAGETTAWRQLLVDKRPSDLARLNELADAAIVEQVRRQIDAGLDVVTDGEQRRIIFMSSFYDGMGGGSEADARITMPDGVEILSDPLIANRIFKAASPAAEEATFLRAVTDFPFKITIPAPSYYFTDFAQIGGGAYSNKLEFVEDAMRVTKAIVADAIAAGTRWVQFDFPVYPALTATSNTQGSQIESVGESREWILEHALRLDAAVTAEIPDDVEVALHICRGSMIGGFWDGSLEPIAERIFNELPHKRFLLEWEDIARHGGYDPIKHVPKDRIVAMGMVSAKSPELESEDAILGHIEDAARHLPIEQLALCPQCGFASSYVDHHVQAEDAQWRKLELIGKVADRVWGGA